MTLFLASVRDVAEAETALLARADIIDLKDPAQGALGAVDLEITRRVVDLIAGRVPVSATIGDLPMQPEAIRDAVIERASCGVDYVKFGLFPGGDRQACFQALRPIALRVRLILVLFADALPAFDAVTAAAEMGATGIMLDTADKHAGSLLTHLDASGIASFVAHAKAQGLMVGLAGSLKAADIPELLTLSPDLLGFRGALCRGRRSASLDPASCASIRALIPQIGPPAETKPSARMTEAAAQALC
jgi:(5-formylfuran-3-yl)methyl phosphate synthase